MPDQTPGDTALTTRLADIADAVKAKVLTALLDGVSDDLIRLVADIADTLGRIANAQEAMATAYRVVADRASEPAKQDRAPDIIARIAALNAED